MPPPADLVAWWPAENSRLDVVGGGTLGGTAGFTAAKVGTGFDLAPGPLSGSGDAFDMQSPGFTVELWMRGVHDQPNALYLVIDTSHGQGGATGWALQGDSTTGTIELLSGNGTGFDGVPSAADLLDGEFHHLAGTWDGTALRFYVDGVLQGTAPHTTPAASPGALEIGSWWGEARRFVGVVDEPSIYHRALAETEIQAIVAAGPAGKCSLCSDGVVGPGEQRDEGAANGTPSACCAADCTLRAAGTECRPVAGDCDVAESCDGASGACPADAFEPSTTTCRPSLGGCDPGEQCPGTGPDWPADAIAPAGTTCRPAAGECDVAETCDGVTPGCPADAFQPVATPCTDDGNPCTLDECNGAGACGHAPNLAPCDDGIFCNGADTCSGGSCSMHAGDPCPGPDGDGDCSETCDEAASACTAPDPDGAACDDGLFCTVDDVCQAGTCGGAPRDCSAESDQCRVGECDEEADACVGPPRPDGTPCEADPCLVGETCTAGTCGGGTATPAACIDTHLCYKAKTTLRTPRFAPVEDVALEDPLEAVTAVVRKSASVCAAADSDGAGLLDPTTHQQAYTIRAKPAVRRTFLEVVDQFGTLRVDTVSSDRLLVPTAIGLGGPPPAGPATTNAYRCYRARVSAGGPTWPKGVLATVSDGFQTKTLHVIRPRRLCIPVDVNAEGVPHPVAHLMCYQVKPASGEPRHTPVVGQLHLLNRFGTLRLDTIKEEELCVPATMGF